MPSTRLLRSVAVGLLAAVIAGPAGALDGFLYTREVQVPTSGWVRVPLDLPAIQHLAAGGADLHVFAPGGEVAVRVAPAVRSSVRRDIAVVKVDKVDAGWTLLLDAGLDAAPHERLFLALAPMTFDQSVRLDGSADGKAWHALSDGELLRLGEEEGLVEVSLSYPQTEDRFLRLAWPEEAGLPRVEAAQVETVSGPSLTFATRGAECQPGGPAATAGVACSLTLPAAGQALRRVTLEIEGPSAVGYRLYAPQDGAWKLLREGTWQRAAGRSQHFLPGDDEVVAGTRLRLELFGAGEPGGAAPRLTGWGVELAAQIVLFRAEEPGLYTLAYGGAARRNQRAEEPPVDAEVAWLTAGPEKEGGPAPLPEALGAPGAPLGTVRFEASWAVLAPSAKPGDLVRLELPDIVYTNARPDLGDVRLSLGLSQIPFYRWTPPEPAPAGGEAGMRPAPTRKAGESEIEILLAAAGLPLTRMILATPGGPLRRMVEVRYLEPLRRSRLPDNPRERMPVARALWECAPEPSLPCREEIKLSGPAPKILSVRLDDGDNPPLAALDTALWRRRDVLLFVWPKEEAGEAVRLQAGSERLTAPAYDFAALGEILPARPWQAAELDLSGAAPAAGASRWARWAMPIVLTIAGLFLLFLLGRILAEH